MIDSDHRSLNQWLVLGSLKFFFYLNDQHVDHTGISDVLVFVEHLPHFVSSLAHCDVQLEHGHCSNRYRYFVYVLKAKASVVVNVMKRLTLRGCWPISHPVQYSAKLYIYYIILYSFRD